MKNKSISYPIIIILNAIFAILAIAYIFAIGGFFREERNAFVQSRKQMVVDYANKAQNTFSSIDGHLLEVQSMLLKDDSASKIRSTSSGDKVMEERRYYEIISQKAATLENLDVMFIVDLEGDTTIWAYGDNLTSSAKINFRSYLEQEAESLGGYYSSKWIPYLLESDYYYLKVYKANGFLVGALSLESNYSSEIFGAEDSEHHRYLKDSSGNIVASFTEQAADDSMDHMGVTPRIIHIEEPVDKTGLILCADFEDNLLDYLRSIAIWVVAVTGALCLVIDLVFIRYLHITLLSPINKLSKGAERIIDGNYNYVAPEDGKGEVLVLQKAFNSAIQTVVKSRIESYEQELKQKEHELLRLRQQLRPHFYLNALAVVKGMAFQNKSDDIQQYIDALTVHVRYLLNNEKTSISLQQEFDHVENYVNMQRICFPGKVTAFLDLEDGIKDIMIPYLLLHTIVENAFKYGRGNNSNLMFTLSARTVSEDDFSGILIEYEDTGEGFEKEYIERFDSSDDFEGAKLGLNNLKQTLKISYADKVSAPMKIMNVSPSGARIEIRIPL